jgi:hypothetical protein
MCAFFKTDMSGKCDSIHSSSKTALTKLETLYYGTGKPNHRRFMHLIGNTTQELDSLRCSTTLFSGLERYQTGHNQVKGQNSMESLKKANYMMWIS